MSFSSTKLPLRSLTSFFKDSKRFKTQYLMVFFIPAETPFRFAVTVPKKNVLLASKRNRLKRRVTETIYKHILQNSVSGDYLLVVSARIAHLSPTQLQQEIEYVFKNTQIK